MTSFLISQFNYCPLIWMICNKGLNIHEGTLRIVYNDHSSSFENLLNKGKSVIIHQRNLQQLAIDPNSNGSDNYERNIHLCRKQYL